MTDTSSTTRKMLKAEGCRNVKKNRDNIYENSEHAGDDFTVAWV